MAKKLKCWKKVRGKGNLWENNSRSQKAQRHIIMRVGVTPIGTEGKFVPYKEIEDEKFLTSNINALTLNTFKSKSQAISFAKSYMRIH